MMYADEDERTCTCGHAFESHDPVDDKLGGACAACDCDEYREREAS